MVDFFGFLYETYSQAGPHGETTRNKNMKHLKDWLAIAFVLSAFATVSAMDYDDQRRLAELEKSEQVARLDFEAHP